MPSDQTIKQMASMDFLPLPSEDDDDAAENIDRIVEAVVEVIRNG